ncbi:Plant organelle RNA recognition domain-containing protein [Cinnamomum micranthum f. kanehirae]|uniref:Plant organelle RNA recognition domain-containing protein n=1 Tax=Cinnamomum micranthum f. kanehirae TaxID=337451 RepID=A0A3S3N9L1_9MAGN|nr:Plant organelle RNA recognition domain-containing protein [Cinnamomum micranthum f. kanehirae]
MASFSSFHCLCRSSLHHGRPNPISCYNDQQRATFMEGAKMKWVRERGLDHAVGKQKHLRPLLSLKNLIVSEPFNSLPLSTISDMKSRLFLPFRAMKFIRNYPSVFLESPSSSSYHRPRIGLTPDVLCLHDDEQSLLPLLRGRRR